VCAQAKSVTVFPFDSTNFSRAHSQAAEKLLAVYLREVGFTNVVSAGGNTPPANSKEAAAQAKASGTDHFILGTVIRIGELAKVSLTIYETATGTSKFTDSLDASSPEDLDPVMKRLARSLFKQKRASTRNSRNDEVTSDEQMTYRRRTATEYFGIKVVGSSGFTAPLADDPMVAGFGLYFLYDVRWLLFEVETTMGFGDKIPFTWNLVDLGVYYPFSQKDMTMYAGGGAGFAMVTHDKADTSDDVDLFDSDDEVSRGMNLFAGIGFLMGRQSTVHFKADFRYFAHMFKMNGNMGHGMKLMVGVGF